MQESKISNKSLNPTREHERFIDADSSIYKAQGRV